ncbi:hypothetical protein MAPG_07658 [Magnaporthiopsis poae ATCC 64411]|uniref:Uncharacterized protein n=1 Tax=Magnaporthiopsis poae (strain ATCC 64411 / 73-15) TaxID=644358 RepID=A0A0C4E592_MAGP6|nr:hypothetical protein MAPG_07658 [Magnaporthiopsis poae ATCC 64411]
MGWSLFAAVISGLNLFRLHRHSRPLWLSANLAADVVLVFFLSVYTLQAWNGAVGSDCDTRTKRPRCKEVAPVLEALLRGGLALCFGLAFTHLVLVMTRLRAVCAAFFQFVASQGNSWSVPAGQLTFEFSIKLARPGERERDGQQRVAGEAAASA